MYAKVESSQMFSHKIRNAIRSALFMSSMAVTLAVAGYIAAGLTGLAVVVVGLLMLMMLTPRASASLALQQTGARPLYPTDAPAVHSLNRELSARAGLVDTPALFWLPDDRMNAFAVGGRGEGAGVALSRGLLQRLEHREVAGVLAHEISHIRHGDLAWMNAADRLRRMTGWIATFGLFFGLFYLPYAVAMGEALRAMFVSLLLVGAPTLSAMLQLALSRTREFQADTMAAELTKDPLGLASALRKIDSQARSVWETLFGYSVHRKAESEAAHMLRTHPPTQERIRRLVSMAKPADSRPSRPVTVDELAAAGQVAVVRPRGSVYGRRPAPIALQPRTPRRVRYYML